MNINEMIKNRLEIVVDINPTIEENIAIKFIAKKIMDGRKNEIFEIPINYIESISLSLKENNIKHKIENNNEYVSNLIKL